MDGVERSVKPKGSEHSGASQGVNRVVIVINLLYATLLLVICFMLVNSHYAWLVWRAIRPSFATVRSAAKPQAEALCLIKAAKMSDAAIEAQAAFIIRGVGEDRSFVFRSSYSRSSSR